MNDAIYRELVKARDHWICQRCGRRSTPYTAWFHAHHWYTRSNQATRHDLDNGVTFCPECHAWAHANPAAARELGREHLGPERWEALSRAFHGWRNRVDEEDIIGDAAMEEL